jgi:hypothetical protein
MKKPRHKLTEREVLGLLKAHHGNVSRTAESLGVGRFAVHYFCKNRPRLQKAISDAKESLVDLAVDRLRELVDAGNFNAINLVVRTIGKDRGFYEKRELIGTETLCLTEVIVESRSPAPKEIEILQEPPAITQSSSEQPTTNGD